jgi:hypothetical protein
MKKNILITACFAFVLGTFFLSGCKKDDTTAPVVTLNGSSSMTISLNSTFVDPGATASDDKDGNISNVTLSGTVDKDTKGDYTLTYSATDAAGNTGTATRTVHVVNDAEPLAGNYNVTDSVIGGSTYHYTQTITTDNHVNKRFHFSKFADYNNNTTIYGTLTTSTTFDIPTQSGTGIGTLVENHTFSGTGIISGNNFGFTYTDVNNSAGGASATGIAAYVKI